MYKTIASFALAAIVIFAGSLGSNALSPRAQAQAPRQAVLIINQWKKTHLAARQNQTVGEAQNAGQPGTHWTIEPVGNTGRVRIRSATTGGYLHVQYGRLQIGQIQPNWTSAMWTAPQASQTAFRLRNVGRPNTFLHNQFGSVAAGPVQNSWWSALWAARPVAQQAAARPANQYQAAPRAGAVSFTNAANAPLQLFWVSPNGQEQQIGTIQARGTVPLNGTVGQSFRARVNGQVVGSYTIRGTQGERHTFGQQQAPVQQQGQAQIVTMEFQNRSRLPLEIFYDSANGGQEYLTTIQPGYKLTQQSPVGAVWRLAQNDQWFNAVRASTAARQLVRFPR